MLSFELRAIPTSSPGGLIASIDAGTPAQWYGLLPGDKLLALNGRPVADEIDLRFHQDKAVLRLTIDRAGEERVVVVRKHPDEDLGVTFADGLFDGIHECNNTCSFCFLKGLPKGLRRSLYFKDDDYRLSFLYGNFVTLTNLKPSDWTRIIEERLSPLYFSVHATDPALRRHLLGNPTATVAMDQLRFLERHGIRVHTQLVVLPGINDGDALLQSIEDLASVTTVLSIGVVPAGMTERGAFSQNLKPELLERLGKKGARPTLTDAVGAAGIVKLVAPLRARFRKERGKDLVYLADEYYLRAGQPIPPRARYDGSPQYQNGIGMVRDLMDQWKAIQKRPPTLVRPTHITAVCGELIAPVLDPIVRSLPDFIPGLTVDLVPVHNTFFGSSVTASGLLTTADVVRTLDGRDLGDVVAFPRQMLDSKGVRFLDDQTPDDLGAALGRPVRPVDALRDLLRIV